MSIQVPIFGSILPISLQPIASEKNNRMHSNELAEGYTLISVTIFIDNIWWGDILKLVNFANFSKTDHFLKLNNQLSSKVQQHLKNDFIRL